MTNRKTMFLGLASLWCCVAWAGAVQAGWMAETALAEAFSGTTIDGHYADGRTFEERYHRDQRIDYVEPGRESSGRWSVAAGAFCTIYNDDPTGGCYRVRRIGKNCFEFYFVARSVSEAVVRPLDTPAWTARGWRRGETSTCLDDPIV